MRIISNCIFTYFTIRINYEQNRKVRILYYSPKNKLSLCQNTEAYKNNLNIKNKRSKSGK